MSRTGPWDPARRVVAAWLPAALYMALIWGLSSFPIAVPVRLVPFRDKGIHFLEYFVLGFLVVHAGLRTWPHRPVLRAAGVGVLVAVAWGVLDELHQALVPGRDADVLDVLADAAGAVTGAAVRLSFRRVRALFRRGMGEQA